MECLKPKLEFLVKVSGQVKKKKNSQTKRLNSQVKKEHF